MYTIYCDREIRARMRFRRWHLLAVFATGLVSGFWLNESGGWPPAAHAQSFSGAEIKVLAAAPDCDERVRTTLRLACTLSQDAPPTPQKFTVTTTTSAYSR